ncbi:MAG: AbrB family transcriptional regulator [Siculibacillus sp.]|nr:AbrB family transcriptional regulator [Siculibacillus sp.]
MAAKERLVGVLRWAGLATASLALALALDFVRLPAAFLFGPLLAGMAFRLAGIVLELPRPAVHGAQALIGGMIGAALTPAIVVTFLADWPVFVAVVAATIAFAGFTGWVLSARGVVPGTTGVWGSAPGAATGMVIQAEGNGGDIRLVAFMQYLRVLFVASAASVGSWLWLGGNTGPTRPMFEAVDPVMVAATLALIGVTGFFGRRLKLAAGAMMLPLFATAILHGAGLVDFVLPRWVLIPAYAGLGWNIGLRFTREAIAHAARALPWIVASIVALMLFSAMMALLLVWWFGVDPLTAFLATSPGGMDTVAVIAASTPVDVSFVMALQVLRSLALNVFGVPLSRFIAARLPQR